MKLTNFVIINLITFSAFAQNWALFPPDQGGYYTSPAKYESYENYDVIKYWSVDSVKEGINEEVRYINSKFLPETYQKCFALTMDLAGAPNSFDSLKYRNDTIFYNIEHEPNPFYFLPNAREGESWIVISEKKKDTIKITYEKKELTEFLGLRDSIKRYSYELIGIDKDSTNIDEQSMLLSKHYGLIEYIDFNKLLSPYYFMKNYETTRLGGIENDSLQTGYQLPSFKTFLPYSPGDILFWRRSSSEFFGPRQSYIYYLDTLTEVVEHEDSLYYVYNRTSINDQNEIYNQQSGLIQSFVFADFENIVGAKPNLWGIGKGIIPYYHSEYADQKIHLWNSVNHLIGEDTVIIAQSRYTDNIMDTTLCQTESTGVSHSFYLESRKGLVERYQNLFDQSSSGFQLIGSKINGVEEGSFEIIVGIEEEIFDHAIQIYPNPAKSYINIVANELWSNPKYSIVDIEARLIEEGNLTEQSIPITHLSAGIYFFKMTVNEKVLILKFVKQAF